MCVHVISLCVLGKGRQKRTHRDSEEPLYEGTDPVTFPNPDYFIRPHLQILLHWDLGLQCMDKEPEKYP